VKRALLVLSLFAAFSPFSFANSATREVLIDQIVSQYVATTIFATDSPMVNLMLQPAMTANQGVSPEIWLSVKT
jgi:hypothetical protein